MTTWADLLAYPWDGLHTWGDPLGLDPAVSAGTLTLAGPRVYADWANDGYGAAGSVDDLTDQVSARVTVTHAFDDGMPSDVSDQTTQPYGQLSTQLGPDATMTATQYFSPFNTASPVYGYDRDVAPVKCDLGVVTPYGVAYGRLFTGRMTDVVPQGLASPANLTAVSATQQKLTTLIQPPAIWGLQYGLNGSWPVSYALAKSGVYVSPPSRTGCRWWAPMHGSVKEFLPEPTRIVSPSISVGLRYVVAGGISSQQRPEFDDDAPYLLGVHAYTDAAGSFSIQLLNLPFVVGTDMVSQNASAGRIEGWVRGDSAATAGMYPGDTNLVYLEIGNRSGLSGNIKAGVDNNRRVFITVNDGTNTTTAQSDNILQSDGAWYFFGVAWDIAGNQLWVRLDRVAATLTPGTAMATTALPARDDFDRGPTSDLPQFWCYLPVCELQVTSGVEANPDNYPWLPDRVFTVGAQVSPSVLELEVLAEGNPLRASDLIAMIAEAELAKTRCDEDDLFIYAPMPYWAQTAQQTQSDTLDTATNVGDHQVRLDVTRIRNSVSISYNALTPDTSRTSVYASTDAILLPPGVTVLSFPLSRPAVSIESLTQSQYDAPDQLHVFGVTELGLANYFRYSYFTVNSASDGSGTYGTFGQMRVEIVASTATLIVLRFNNLSSSNLYLANNQAKPSLNIAGIGVNSVQASATVSDSASVAARGERGLAVTLAGAQDAQAASLIAGELLGRLSKPRKRIENIKVLGDPRRRPGMVASFTDAAGTAASGLWRIMSVQHEIDGASYVQTISVEQFWGVGLWDTDLWDQALWGV